MTSERIEAYGGIAFPATLLRSFAEGLDGGQIPFHLDHDLTKPSRIRNIEIFVKDRDDGISELRFRAEMHADDLQYIDSRPGMSATVTSPLARDEDASRPRDTSLQLSADHAWFADEALIGAEEQLLARGLPAGKLSVERAFQFSVIPDAQIFVVVVLPFMLSLGASALWDGIKHLLAGRRTPPGGDPAAPTTVNIEITDGDRTLRAVVTTVDDDVAKRAVESVEALARQFQQSRKDAPVKATPPVQTTVWDEPTRRWTPPS